MKITGFWDVMSCGFVRGEVSKELVVCIINVKRISELGTKLVVTTN
jgi:hypothetical protein